MTAGAVLESVEAALVGHFGVRPARASRSFLGVEPIEVLRFDTGSGRRSYATLGMSRHPMSGGAAVVTPDGPRAELVLDVQDPADLFVDVWRSLAVLGATPVVEAAVHAPGTSTDLGQPIAPGSSCCGIVIGEDVCAAVATGHGEVRILAALPATRTELAWCRVRGGPTLRAAWAAAGVDLRDLARAGVSLGPGP